MIELIMMNVKETMVGLESFHLKDVFDVHYENMTMCDMRI